MNVSYGGPVTLISGDMDVWRARLPQPLLAPAPSATQVSPAVKGPGTFCMFLALSNQRSLLSYKTFCDAVFLNSDPLFY